VLMPYINAILLRKGGALVLAKRMKKADIVDEFMKRLRNHPALQIAPRLIDDLEAVLHALFVSDDERAIEMSDEIRGVIERKHMTVEKRVAMIQRILREGRIYISAKA
jgi:hypothetical protein